MPLIRRKINAFVKKTVRFFGYDLVKSAQKAQPYPKKGLNPGSPLKVEFIGPSGVGKSTIIKEMVLQKTKDEKWVVAGELTNRYEKSDSLALSAYDVLLGIHTEQMMVRAAPLRKKIVLLRYYLKLVSEEELINRVAGNNTVVFHEGLFHNGGASIIELEKTHSDVFIKIIRNKAIVNCTADPETIVKYIRNRQKQGARRTMLEGYSDRELMEKAQNALNKKKELVELLKNYKIPCLEINTTESITKNARKIRSFIKQISASAFSN